MPKPNKKKNKFIDPKKDRCVSFKLIHRAQRDPLAADDETPQRVLQFLKNPNLEKQKEEERNCGVYFNDEYNYLQHLKNRNDQGKDFSALDKFLLEPDQKVLEFFNIPSSVLPSKEEEEVGLLNKAAPRRGPRLDWDPDIVAALDEDFDYENPENILDDDFMQLANVSGEENDEDDDHYFDTDEERDEVGSLENFSDEETKSRFTNYSMSSSIIRRNEGLKLLDDKFENFFADYDEMNIGSLACDDIEGNFPEASDMMDNIVKDYNLKKESDRTKNFEFQNNLALVNEDDGMDTLKNEFERVHVQVGDEWDCETVLTTYSNIYNHPKLISERTNPIKISGKTGMPKDVLGKGLTASALKRFNALNGDIDRGNTDMETATHASRVSKLSFRNKYETKEEKKARKEGMKEYKRERRIERKANRDEFKAEKVKQEKIQFNNRNNQQGIKLL
ncbi:protein LTV1 homolog [Lepeophtheirus salmonis]|uniref:protein LTV1 homolog n=1 Tax=Lepeophtheirus salmonis TaxID=72036 RepID=UPI001AE6B97A|nr:protein LTV1 homolog [Lepeophtheirus salmonis]